MPAIALSFPNESRSYDATRGCVRFWGHDSALEISFFVHASALCKLRPQTVDSGADDGEAAFLAAFDEARARILEVAIKAYKRRPDYAFVLLASDF
ncbi:MAG: DUF1488 domain-containing protein [Kiloniellales bacterium]